MGEQGHPADEDKGQDPRWGVEDENRKEEDHSDRLAPVIGVRIADKRFHHVDAMIASAMIDGPHESLNPSAMPSLMRWAMTAGPCRSPRALSA